MNQKDLNPEKFSKEILDLLNNTELKNKLSEIIKKVIKKNANEEIVKIIKQNFII